MTPVCQKFWKNSSHPDFVGWVLRGLQEGFRLGFDDTKVYLSSAHSIMSSANQHPELVSQYIQKEVSAGHLLRINPSEGALHCRIHTSPLGVIPKRGRLDQWRLIMDLSSPHGHSVNDGISVELCSLHYALVDDAVTQLGKLGHGALLAKMDIRQAYRNIPVAPPDRYLLGLRWQ